MGTSELTIIPLMSVCNVREVQKIIYGWPNCNPISLTTSHLLCSGYGDYQ